jgi:hypothetical protein
MKLRDMETPKVLGYELDRTTLTPVRHAVGTSTHADWGCDPVGDGTFRMVPSGDIVDLEERERRLARLEEVRLNDYFSSRKATE